MLQFIHIERRKKRSRRVFVFWFSYIFVLLRGLSGGRGCQYLPVLYLSFVIQHTTTTYRQLRIILINCIREPSTGYQQGYYQDIIRIPIPGITAI